MKLFKHGGVASGRADAQDLNNLLPFERHVYSQNGEDGVIEEVFRRVGAGSKFAVEFGVESGKECNTRLLKEFGWQVLQMDGDKSPGIVQEYITAENINQIFKKHHVPYDLDFLGIDIDSNDYWVWKALEPGYKPRLVVIEYNAHFAPIDSKSVAYDPKLTWSKTRYFGASLLAMYRLGQKKGYDLIYCDKTGANAFFVRQDLMPGNFEPKTPVDVYRGPLYGRKSKEGLYLGHAPTNRKFVDID